MSKVNNQVFKINNQLSICLDKFFDLDSLHKIFPELVRGVVQSKNLFEPIDIANQHAIFQPEHLAPTIYIRDVFCHTDEYKELKGLGFTDSDVYHYVNFKYPVKSLGTKLLLRTYPEYSKEFGTKHLSQFNFDTKAYDFFPSFRSWIENSRAFKETGRILFFINDFNTYTPTHCDYSNFQSHKDQFIWINLFSKKRFFLLDESWNKHYLKGEINIFDNAVWHGSEPAKHSCFTIRIDGLFSEEFLNKTGLYEHFAQNL